MRESVVCTCCHCNKIKISCSQLFNNRPFLCTGPCKEEFVSERIRPCVRFSY